MQVAQQHVLGVVGQIAKVIVHHHVKKHVINHVQENADGVVTGGAKVIVLTVVKMVVKLDVIILVKLVVGLDVITPVITHVMEVVIILV